MNDLTLPPNDPVGRCIYCGSRTPPLTNEHTIPEGLGGREFLRDASCEECRIETCRFENHVQRNTLWPMRIRMGFRGKRKPAERIPTLIVDAQGNRRIEDLDPHDIKIGAVIPRFTRPGMLIGAPMQEIRDAKLDIYGGIDAHQKKNMQTRPISIYAFVQMLAKIAHAGAVRRVWLDSFEPFLCDLIRGRSPIWAYYIGCDSMDLPPSDNDFGSWVQGDVQEFNGERIVVMKVRLFAQLGTPIFEVITGRMPA